MYISGVRQHLSLRLCIKPAFGHIELVLLDGVHRVQPQFAACGQLRYWSTFVFCPIERYAAHGQPRPAHPARGGATTPAPESGLKSSEERVCVFDGARGMQVVRCCHVWCVHD